MAEWTVGEDGGGRADLFLAQNVPTWSRRQAQQAIQAGAVLLHRDGRRVRLRKGDGVRAGDRLEVDPAWLQPVAPGADLGMEMRVVFQDEHLLVVDKPAGIPTTVLHRGELRTVASFLVAHWPETAKVGRPSEAGLVHRLDTQTSGLLIAGRSGAVYELLRRQLRERRIDKQYLALVHGRVAHAGRIDTEIAHDPRHPERMCLATTSIGGRAATTFFEPADGPLVGGGDKEPFTLLRIRIPTGVRHQIRLHLASIGHPVVGDRLYGSERSLPDHRHLLHASQLRFLHPRTDAEVCVESPLPEDFQAALPAQK